LSLSLMALVGGVFAFGALVIGAEPVTSADGR
jgi:hypothetical protein